MNRLDLATVLSTAAPVPGRRGPWQYRPRTLEIVLRDERGAEVYAIDLERCATSAGLLDWVYQVAAKAFVSDADLGAFVRLAGDLLDPQATLCSFGRERGPIDVPRILGRR